MREKTVRRLNRQRSKDKRIPFQNKYSIARQMLADLRPLLPRGWKVYVQFDSWYSSKRLIKYICRQNWYVTCALKYNRKLNNKGLSKHAQALKHRWYTPVSVTTADGDKRTYYVRWLEGRLVKISRDVRVYFSKRHPREKSLALIAGFNLFGSRSLARIRLALVMRSS